MRDFFKKFSGHFLPGSHNSYRPHLLRKPWLLFFLTVILTAEGLYIAGGLAEQRAYEFLSAVLPGEVIALTNTERAKIGSDVLAEDALLALAAQNKANDMAAKSYFSHVGPDGKEPWGWLAEAGYTYRYAGENLAVRFDQSSDVVNAWMASPTHRANIVKPVYTEIGIGIAEGMYEGQRATFVVQYFGTPMLAQAASSAVAPAESAPLATTLPNTAEVAGASTEEEKIMAASSAPVQTNAPVLDTQTDTAPQAASRAEAQTFLRASDASKDASLWILGGVAALLIALVGLTVFVHIAIQPTELILGGSFVGVVAISLWMLNTSFEASQGLNGQSAAVGNAVIERSILVGEDGISF